MKLAILTSHRGEDSGRITKSKQDPEAEKVSEPGNIAHSFLDCKILADGFTVKILNC